MGINNIMLSSILQNWVFHVFDPTISYDEHKICRYTWLCLNDFNLGAAVIYNTVEGIGDDIYLGFYLSEIPINIYSINETLFNRYNYKKISILRNLECNNEMLKVKNELVNYLLQLVDTLGCSTEYNVISQFISRRIIKLADIVSETELI